MHINVHIRNYFPTEVYTFYETSDFKTYSSGSQLSSCLNNFLQVKMFSMID